MSVPVRPVRGLFEHVIARRRSAVLRPTAGGTGRAAQALVAARAAAEAQDGHPVADWLRHLGSVGTIVTTFHRDGGVDARSIGCLLHVPAHQDQPHGPPHGIGHGAEPVRLAAVEQLHATAAAESRRALLVSAAGYDADAHTVAAASGVALFVVRSGGELVAANVLAYRYLHDGLPVDGQG